MVVGRLNGFNGGINFNFHHYIIYDIENNYTNFGLNPYKIRNIDDNMDNIYDANELDDMSGSDELATIMSEMEENNMSFKIVRPKVCDILENDV